MRKPWENEPDLLHFEAHGLRCMIRRHPTLKHLNGYVELPAGHPANGKNYDDLDVDVHGGLTFGKPWKDEGPLTWLGFDCAHSGDLVPGGLRSYWHQEEYRDIAYVRAECERLAEQLARMQTEAA